MGWFVGPVNGTPAVFHQGETFTYHANVVLLPQTNQGVVVLMNAENSLDLFTRGRMATVAEGVVSLLRGQEPPSPPSRMAIFVAYALLLAVIALQLSLMIRSVNAFRHGRVPRGRLGAWGHIAVSLLANVAWAALILIVVPQKVLGLPLPVLAQGLPDFAYLLLISGVVALGWGIGRQCGRSYSCAQIAAPPRPSWSRHEHPNENRAAGGGAIARHWPSRPFRTPRVDPSSDRCRRPGRA